MIRNISYPKDFIEKVLKVFANNIAVNYSFRYGNELVGEIISKRIDYYINRLIMLKNLNIPNKDNKIIEIKNALDVQKDLYIEFENIILKN